MVSLVCWIMTVLMAPGPASSGIASGTTAIPEAASEGNGTYLGGSTIDVGWVRHAVCAVTHRMCRQALVK
jgi:hypothetical protein